MVSRVVSINLHFFGSNLYPALCMRSEGKVIALGLYVYLYLQKFNLSKYSLSEVHSNTGKLLFEFNSLQYTLAAPEVFMAFANPVSLPSGYRVSIVRNTNIDNTPLRYLHAS